MKISLKNTNYYSSSQNIPNKNDHPTAAAVSDIAEEIFQQPL